LVTFDDIEKDIDFNKKYPEIKPMVSVEDLEKRKVFLPKAFAFIQSLRDEGYFVRFIPKTIWNALPHPRSLFSIHIIKNPKEYSLLQKEAYEKVMPQPEVEKELYMVNFPDGFTGFNYDDHHELYPGAKTLKNKNAN
jgi:hypothetical protein